MRPSPGRCCAARLPGNCLRLPLAISRQAGRPTRLVHFEVDVLQLFISLNL
jgi:hypothetical protein